MRSRQKFAEGLICWWDSAVTILTCPCLHRRSYTRDMRTAQWGQHDTSCVALSRSRFGYSDTNQIKIESLRQEQRTKQNTKLQKNPKRNNDHVKVYKPRFNPRRVLLCLAQDKWFRLGQSFPDLAGKCRGCLSRQRVTTGPPSWRRYSRADRP
ncbi:hypothetical protein RRG08_015846 [Elysia crispata]|uniref:Uncharacterized protein n=1 Tax=Elysia crispata TaxID=231223 RepID=A0AAE0Y3D0_9GAST|nr:hypothetical protein RRG08_015846 [Elysia crispata]